MSKRLYVLRNIRKYTSSVKGSIVGLILISLTSIPISLISPKFFQILIDDVMREGQKDRFFIVTIGLMGVYLIRLFVDGMSLVLGNRILNKFTYKIRSDVFTKFCRAPFSLIEKKNVGELKMRLMDDVDSLGDFIREQVVNYISNFVMLIGTFYLSFRISVNMTLMSFVLKKGNSVILQRGFEEHWWLTGFKWGMFTENPNDLNMSITLAFANEGMKNAFISTGNSRNLRGRGYSYSSEEMNNKYNVSFDFKIPKSPQPSTMNNYGAEIQNNNKLLVDAYNVVMTTLNIENNDLNLINESFIMSGTNQALKEAYSRIKEYMNNEMATIKRYELN